MTLTTLPREVISWFVGRVACRAIDLPGVIEGGR